MNFNDIIPSDFRGCISVRKDGVNIYSACQGYRDLANQIPNTIDTKFATASAGKVFVAVAILQLIEQGKLSFDSKIGDLLSFDLHNIDKDINISQLLNHTSGIPDYFDESIMDDYDELWTDYPNYKIRKNSDLLPLFIDKPMMYEKGERFQYNNTGYVILALIIEEIIKKPFDQYLNEAIFTPCQMNDTGYYELDRLPSKCACAYIWDEERNEYYTNIYSVDVKGTGAGGAFTTVNDIERFWDALLSYKLLSEEMTNNMLSVQATSSHNEIYGYGVWFRKYSQDYLLPYFMGCDPGVSFVSIFSLEKNINITIVSNYCDDVWSIRNSILESML